MSILTAPGQIAGAVLDPIAASIKNPFNRTVNRTGQMPGDFPGGLVITEFVNGAPVVSTAIKLIGNLMPYQPFTWGGEQRLVKDYYPGNPEPAVQVLGGKEAEVSIKGKFKDKRYRDSKLYGVSYELSKACDRMRQRGNLVRVAMYGNAGNWIRYGFLEKSTFTMKKQSEIEYDLVLFVVSERQPKNNKFASPEKEAPSALNQSMIDAATKFQSTYSSIPATVPQSIADVLNGIISDIATNVNLVTNFVGTIISTAQDIKKSADRALGLIKNARTFLAVSRRQIGALVHDFGSLSADARAASKFRGTFANLEYMSGMHTSIIGMSQNLAKLQANFDKIAKTIPIARYKVTEGDTLQRIAVKYYGSLDNWKLIYDHNKLHTSLLVGGQILEIPRA